MFPVDELTREQLLQLVRNFAKNWLVHDGLWFQAVEQSHGLDEAIAADTEAWRRFSPIEARRIKEFLGLPERGGLEALRTALEYRMYAVRHESPRLRWNRLRRPLAGAVAAATPPRRRGASATDQVC